MSDTVLSLGDISVTREEGLYLHGTLSWRGGGLTYQVHNHECIITRNNSSEGKVIASWVCIIKEQ